jgi:hypothetical protein
MAAPPPVTFTTPSGVQPWPFQEATTSAAHKVIEGLKQSGFSPETEFGSMASRLIRAAMLDKTIYQEVCADPAAAKQSRMAMAFIIGLASVAPCLLALGSFSSNLIVTVLASATIQAAGWCVRAWVIQLVAAAWLKKSLTYGQVFRPLVYAQAPAALAFVPAIGQYISLWALATNTAAIRDTTGCNTIQAVVLSIVGVVGVMLCSGLVAPIVYSIYRILG